MLIMFHCALQGSRDFRCTFFFFFFKYNITVMDNGTEGLYSLECNSMMNSGRRDSGGPCRGQIEGAYTGVKEEKRKKR